MKLPHHLTLCALLVLAPIGPAPAQQSGWLVEPFQGATSAQGALARMRVANTGNACAVVNYGVPAERANPAGSGHIKRQPAHGKAEFAAPHANHTPEQGYVGEDEFAYEAVARGRLDQQVRLKVHVKVSIVAP